tara:strand:+ start:582 stop:800 length:219 start_codon:yes stop_codon:yes gene_type:complete
MLTQFKLGKLIKNLFKNTNPPTMLGRWRTNNQDHNTIYANYDNCGDELCGNVKEVKKDIKKIKKKYKFYKVV